MSAGSLVSYAQNAEDVVLWRALQHVANGHYVEVGANHPRTDSVTRLFYERGWSGITIEPLEDFVALHREQRPRDIQLQVAVTADDESESVVLHAIPGTGLSSIVDVVGERSKLAGHEVEDLIVPAMTLERVFADVGWADKPIHFMLIDVEGAEAETLSGLDLQAHRPWVIVVEATQPNSSKPTHDDWESDLVAAGYSFCLFDGLSRFYIADEHREEMAATLSYPACVLDDYIPARFDDELRRTAEQLHATSAELERQVMHWKRTALVEWADEIAADGQAKADAARLNVELAAVHDSTSWRLTEPLRGARRAMGRTRRTMGRIRRAMGRIR